MRVLPDTIGDARRDGPAGQRAHELAGALCARTVVSGAGRGQSAAMPRWQLEQLGRAPLLRLLKLADSSSTSAVLSPIPCHPADHAATATAPPHR